MKYPTVLPSLVAVLVSVGYVGAAAADTGQDDAKEAALVLSAKTSIAQAVETAARQTGGQPLKASLEKDNDAFTYEIAVVAKDKVVEVMIDPASGRVLQTENEGLIERLLDGESDNELAGLLKLPTTLSDAIATAEQDIGGKAIEAGIDDENAVPLFEIEVAKNNTIKRVYVDGTSGEIAAGPADEDRD
ncbi:MAG: hypothetical protein CMM50_10105 [Rhodospirillaceae bacterium]|nr:hypothetical protein [Rhodospirillaceae bacterium]